MTIQAQLADGTVLEFPDGTDPNVIQATVKRQIGADPQIDPNILARAQQRNPDLIPKPEVGLETFVDPALTLATGAIAEPLAGLTGIAATIAEGPEAGAKAVETVRNALTFQPTSAQGKAGLQALGETLEPVVDVLEKGRKATGEAGFDIAGPIGGAVGEAAFEGLLMVAGGLPAKGAGRLRRASKAKPSPEQAAILQSGKELNTPILTTDILPPDSFAGKSLQQLSEKLGPLGTGNKRAAQQRARSDIVVELADEFNADLDAPFEADIVKSLKKKNADELSIASEQRNRSIDTLVPFGDVPVAKTQAAIQKQLDRQARLGLKADSSQIDNLNNISGSIDGNDFSVVKDIRQEVISDLKAARRSDDARAAGALQSIKSAIDKDMIAFARKNDKKAAKDWLASNRKFAFELGNVKNTELKRLIETGDITPEKVGPILKGGKISELQRLNKSLTPKGKESAKAAIIRSALTDSGFFASPNPDRLATTLLKPNYQKAIGVFFKGNDKKRVEGLSRLLDATRRAQQAAVSTPTGQQIIPLAVGGGAVADPLTTIITAGSLAVVTRAYESAAVRNLLIKLANSKPGSAAERNLILSAGAATAATIQAQQEQQ
jgi:hypothetical protein